MGIKNPNARQEAEVAQAAGFGPGNTSGAGEAGEASNANLGEVGGAQEQEDGGQAGAAVEEGAEDGAAGEGEGYLDDSLETADDGAATDGPDGTASGWRIPPAAPEDLEPSLEEMGASLVSMRQVLGYLCVGKTPIEGLEKLLQVFAPQDEAIPMAQLHALFFRLGIRPRPFAEPDGKPSFPSLEEFGSLYGSKEAMLASAFLEHPKTQQLLKRKFIGALHTSPMEDLERLIPSGKGDH